MEATYPISYSVIGLIQFSVMLLVMGHWCVCCSGSRKQDDPRLTLRPPAFQGWACLWIMTAEMGKEDTEAEFCPAHRDRTGIEDRTAAEAEGCLSMQQYSWLDALQDGGITTYAGWENHFDKWSAAMYWSIVTITSVGYGDITPQNPGEMRICTLLLLWGSCLWAYIIGNACGIVSTLDVHADAAPVSPAHGPTQLHVRARAHLLRRHFSQISHDRRRGSATGWKTRTSRTR